MTTHSRELQMPKVEPFTGGGGTMMAAGGVGVVGLLLTLVGAFVAPKETSFSYLFAFVYWVGISVAGLILLSSFNAANARWIVVIRRAMELIAGTVPIFVLLFIPVLLSMKHVFPWVDPPADLSREAKELLAHKAPYLNVTAFIIRAVIYFAVWIGVSQLLYGWSRKQDTEGGRVLTYKQRVLGACALPFLGLTITFAGFDWLMSLTPLWGSTIFGAYYFAGSFLASIAVLTLTAVWSRGNNQHFGELVTRDHLHNLGKLMLAFTAFWAYIAFSQYLLIWIANLPEEITWYVTRTRTDWMVVFAILILGHFVLPFFMLLSRQLKLRLGFLRFMAFWLLTAHAVDLYWVVIPSLNGQAPQFHWTIFTAFIGVGGVAVAFGIFRARGGYLVPVKDPFLADSLRYTQP